MQKVLLDRSYVLGFNLAIIVLIIELFIYLSMSEVSGSPSVFKMPPGS